MKGFTLIELMIAIVIGIGITSVGIISLSDFYAKQKVDGAITEISGMVRLAKNYAVTMQSPGGYIKNVDFVVVRINSNGLLTIAPGNNTDGTDVGATYVSKVIDMGSVDIITPISNGDLMFSIPEGKLVMYTGVGKMTTPRPSDDVVNITIVSKQNSNLKNGIQIHSSGIIEEKVNSYVVVPTATGGAPPTPSPTLVPCRGSGVACSADSQCCTSVCDLGFCTTCRALNSGCVVNSDCCSNNCNVNRCGPAMDGF